MSRNDLNIEDLFRTQMETYQVDPSPGLWQKVHSRILWKQFLGFSFQTFNVYYLTLALSLAGLGTIALLSDRDKGVAETTLLSPLETEAASPAKGSESIPFTPAGELDSQTPSDASNIKKPEKQAVVSQSAGSGKKTVEETKSSVQSPAKTKDSPGTSAKENSAINPSDKKSESNPVKVEFTTSQIEGCSPMAVSFVNRSENIVKSAWVFGDGGSTFDKHPSYVFDEPGEYTVTLKVTGMDEQVYTAFQIIRVFESPKAIFEMDEDVDLSKNQPVYFYNYSRGADYYKWDFGDGEQSSLLEPIHYYSRPESYNVKLKVWTQHQCYDSLVIQSSFTGTEGEIRFPNAFTPNISGPTGGYYEINDISNTIFHPVVKGELLEYQLKIFNRQGLQIFESNEISIGWDGYYQEKLAGQDVYIWKARGKFSNGKTFIKSGDLTLIKPH